jgi:hypothetical protein
MPGGTAHLFPPFFCFGGKHFPFLDGLTVSHLTKNWTGKQQTASDFSTPWTLPPPHDCKIPFSFQWRWCINSLIGNCQCTYYLIVRALTISIFCFSCSLGHSHKKTLFLERLSTVTKMKASSCLLCLPFHNTAMVLCQCQGNCHHALFLPRASLPYAPLLRKAERG